MTHPWNSIINSFLDTTPAPSTQPLEPPKRLGRPRIYSDPTPYESIGVRGVHKEKGRFVAVGYCAGEKVRLYMGDSLEEALEAKRQFDDNLIQKGLKGKSRWDKKGDSNE